MNEAIEYGVEDLPAEGLASVSEYAQALRAAQAEKFRLEMLVAAQQGIIDRITTQEIPAAMKELKLKSFTLDDGTKVAVEDEVHCGIPAPRLAEALAWLRRTGNESLIKTAITVWFGKGEDEAAIQLADYIADNFPENQNERKVGVHPSTLKAFVKEWIEKEEDEEAPLPESMRIPRDVFGVFIINRANFKKPKAKKEIV